MVPKQRGEHRARRSPVIPGDGRETVLKRRTNRREQRTSILVATNGECTEIAYLKALRVEPWIRNARMSVVFEKGSPVDVVKAIAGRRDRDDYDEAWVVCDVDNYDTDIASARATEFGVHLVWSNPCFEVWLILHKAECTAYLEDAKRATRRLCQVLPGWDKTKLNFATFRDGVWDATQRAQTLGDPPAANPATHMWKIIEVLGSPATRDH